MKILNQMKKDSHVVFSISIGQEDQTGENFDKMIELIIKNENIKEITIFKTDTLQRWRWKAIGLSDEEAEKEAKKASLKWDEENKVAIEKLQKAKKVHIKSWDDYRKDDDGNDSKLFLDMLGNIKIYSEGYSDFRRKVNKLAGNFLNKYKKQEKNIEKLNDEIALGFFKEYIFEECSVLVLLSQDKVGYNYELYLGKRNSAMTEVYKKYGNKSNMISNPILDDLKEEKFYGEKSKNSNKDTKNNFSFQLFGPGINISIDTNYFELKDDVQEVVNFIENFSRFKSNKFNEIKIKGNDNDSKRRSINNL